MEAQTIRLGVTCQLEAVEQVVEAIKGLGKQILDVREIPNRSGARMVVFDTERSYSNEMEVDLFIIHLREEGYEFLFYLPGVFEIDIVEDQKPIAMTEVEAKRLAAQIRQDAAWLVAVSVRPAYEVNDDFPSDTHLYVCWIEGQSFQAEIYNAVEWGRLWERLDYDRRMAEYREQIEEPDVRPFHRYVLDEPMLPHFGSYSYLNLERHAVRNFLLEASMPPWRSAVRSTKGARAIYTLSGVRVPVSVAPFVMQVGDQALVVIPAGEIGLLIRER